MALYSLPELREWHYGPNCMLAGAGSQEGVASRLLNWWLSLLMFHASPSLLTCSHPLSASLIQTLTDQWDLKAPDPR